MANRFIGGVQSSRPQTTTPFVSRASNGTYFDKTGTLVTATGNQPRLNYSFVGSPIGARHSGLFAGASNLSVAQTTSTDLGSANFTIEMWIYFTGQNTTGATNNNIVGKWNSGSQWILQFRAAGLDSVANQHWRFYFNGSSGTDFQEASTTAVQLNTWHHIALVRNGSSFIFYRNGVQVGTTFTSSSTITSTSDTMTIGSAQNNAYGVTGYISNFRMVTGTAVYTGAFTVPTGILTATQSANPFGGSNTAAIASGTQVLTLQNSGFTDYSSNNFTLTNTGVTANAFLPPLNYTSDFSGTGWSNPTVLIEPASTNLNTYSSTFTSGWTLNGVTSIATNNTAPDGTNTATQFSDGTSASYKDIEANFALSATTYTLSAFVKSSISYFILAVNFNGDTPYVNVIFNMATGTVYTTNNNGGTYAREARGNIVNIGNGWYRLSLTYTVTASISGAVNTHRIGPSLDGTNTQYGGSSYQGASRAFNVWGVQLEQSNGATSYIATNGSAVTRAQDNVGLGFSGMFSIEDRQNTTAIDDQFTVTSFTTTGSTIWTAPDDVTSVEVLIVAGGGAGGGGSGAIGAGGGGAGGIVYNTNYTVVPGTTYPVIVGAGGVGVSRNIGTNGGNSQFGALVALGGGAGGSDSALSAVGRPGGSGGGGTGRNGIGAGGTAGQGNPGSNGAANAYYAGGGGGGAGGPAIPFSGSVAGSGGPGLYFNISGTATAYGGGGGGGGSNYSSVSTAGTGGVGGGGAGTSTSINGTAGTANTGGGGGASGWSTDSGSILGGNGGSGIVIVKFKRTPKQLASTSNAAIVVQRFTTSNIWTVPTGVTQVEALVVAGGGGGGNGTAGGGGGAGGVVYSSALTVTPGSTYTIGVGAGGLGAGDTGAPAAYSGFGSGVGTGAELITNGTGFTATTGWTATTATLSVPQTGIFRITPNISVNGTASQSITTTNGVTYLAVVKVTNDPTKNFRLRIGTTQVGAEIADFFTAYTRDSLDNGLSGAGFYSVTFTATGSTTWINMQIGGGTQQPTDISYISVRQASLPAFGGGYGASEGGSGSQTGGSGGSGGGGRYGQAGSAGIASQGNAGGSGYSSVANVWTGGGGGGAGSAGGNAITFYPGNGGAGVAYAITGNLEYYGGGGGGSSQNYGVGTVYPGLGGIGGGGTGAADQTGSTVVKGADGAPNTGGGGGAQANQTGSGSSGNGGSGVVILRYRVPAVAVFQDSGSWTCPAGVTSVQALIVAGGGGGGAGSTGSQLGGGGAGAGGLIYDNSIPVTPGTTYSVVVGQGGTPGITVTSAGTNGQNSSFANLIAIGGGYGGVRSISEAGGSGGSGGAGAGNPVLGGSATYGQGNIGAGSQIGAFGGGGGGAGAAGAAGQAVTEPCGGSGGIGLQYSISGTATYYAGGGSSGAWGGDQIIPASLGGGGSGGPTRQNGQPGAINTGGGGGGSGSGYRNVSVDTAATKNGAHGGSGIVIIRWIGG